MAPTAASGRVAFTARLPEPLHKRLRVWCANNDSDLQDAVTLAVKTLLDGASAGHSPVSCPLAEAPADVVKECRLFLSFLQAAPAASRSLIHAALKAGLTT